MMSEGDTSDESDYSIEGDDTTRLPDASIFLHVPHKRSSFHVVCVIENKQFPVRKRLADIEDIISLTDSNEVSRRHLFSNYWKEARTADKVFSDALEQIQFQLEHIFSSTEVCRVQYIFAVGLFFTAFVAQAAAEDMGIPDQPKFHFLYADESFRSLNPLLAEIWGEIITWEDPNNEAS